MFTARLAKEVTVRVYRTPKAFVNVTKLLADKGFDLTAASAWSEDGKTAVRFVTDEHLRAMDALRERELEPEECEVLVVEVPHRPGMLRRIAEILANEGVDFDHLYASSGETERKTTLVLAAGNNERALLALRTA